MTLSTLWQIWLLESILNPRPFNHSSASEYHSGASGPVMSAFSE